MTLRSFVIKVLPARRMSERRQETITDAKTLRGPNVT